MPGNLPVPNGTQLKLVWSIGGVVHALNILHCRNQAGTDMSQVRADQIDAAVKSALTSSGLLAQLGIAFGLARVESRNMDAASDPWFLGSTPGVNGAGAEHLLPPAVSCVVTTLTGLRGRSFRGRVYLTGFTELANTAAGAIETAAQSAGAVFLQNVRINLLAPPIVLELAVLSRFTTIPPATEAIERNPPILTPVTNQSVLDSRWDTQRRRGKPGV